MKKILYLSLLTAFLYTQAANAQNILNTEINATPLAVNPAFTGMFNGNVRAGIIYSNRSSSSATVPYTTDGAFADLPLFTNSKGDYLAAGIQLTRDQSYEGNLANFNGLLSLAYHKIFRKANDSNNLHTSHLSFGLQGGYSQVNFDLSQIYFGHYYPSAFVLGVSSEYQLENQKNYYPVNGGICFSHQAGAHLNYTIGVAGYNLNLPYRNTIPYPYGTYGDDRRYIGEIGADWSITNWLTLRPQIRYQSQANANGVVAGNEFDFKVSKPAKYRNIVSVFAGAWYHTGNAMMITTGIAKNHLQIGFSYDFNYAPLYYTEYGSGGFAVSLKYIFKNQRSLKRTITGTRY